jgi:hypothetical protein
MSNAFFHNGHHKSSIQTVYEKGLKDGQIKGIQDVIKIIDEQQYTDDAYVDDSILIEIQDKLRDLYASE